ncbi:hypothetical protein EYF80_020374 [Liparis tanakae]|uniref:Uncharacterized protein n=1 Tax=Liparis tanakae TaxID=230148 RepID=A0A4Z2HWL6_9TELE|nr:hypothetical protein EYF80_020374 [Liparis tanakae]
MFMNLLQAAGLAQHKDLKQGDTDSLGHPFIPRLLDMAGSVPNVHDHVALDEGCCSDLRFWALLLDHWNGVTIFYNDLVNSSDSLQFYTDAVPSIRQNTPSSHEEEDEEDDGLLHAQLSIQWGQCEDPLHNLQLLMLKKGTEVEIDQQVIAEDLQPGFCQGVFEAAASGVIAPSRETSKKRTWTFEEANAVEMSLMSSTDSGKVPDEPSVHWKVYFLRLLRRGVQQVPCPSAPPAQLPRHSRRETFSWVWHAA